jgi:hypothetical protein
MNAACRLILSVSAAALGAVALMGVPALAAAAEAPKVEEASVTEVASTSATLDAKVTPGGAETLYAFEYAPAGGSFKPVPEAEGNGRLPEGAAGVALSVHVQGLLPSASYEFRLVASNSVEAVTGEVVSFTTQLGGGGFALPDGREYEMVTPPQKEGALFFGLGRFYQGSKINPIQASVAGNAIVDLASQPTEAEPQGYNDGVSVLSTRSLTGWSARTMAPPHVVGGGPDIGGPSGEFVLFSEDLSRGIVQPYGSFSPYSPEATEQTPYLHANYLNGNLNEPCQNLCFQPLVTRADDTASPFVPFGGSFDGNGAPGSCENSVCGPFVRGASPDLSHVVLASVDPLTATPASGNDLYEWYGGHLRLVSVLPGETTGTHASLAGGILDSENNERDGASRAISENGERVIFLGENGIDMRDVGRSETVLIGTGFYMTASRDASKVFFLEDGNLKVFEVVSGGREPLAGKVTDLTVDPHAGEDADVVTVLGASDDGSYVYFAAGGGLTPGAVPAVPGEAGTCSLLGIQGGSREDCKIYVSHNGVTSLVATGWISTDEKADTWSRVSHDGRWLAFMSSRSLTGYDNRDANSGEPDDEVYLYDADTGRLVCASCDPTGARPVGVNDGPGVGWVAANVPGWTGIRAFGETRYQSRYLSDSGRLFFESTDALVPQDVNGVGDVYEYEPEGVPGGEHACSAVSASGSDVVKPAREFEVEGRRGVEGAGCVALISAGTSSEESSFLDASETGGDVFFLTTSRLAPQDFDDSPDVYDAHECTSGSPCIAPPVTTPPTCSTEASCRPAPAPQPAIYGLPSSATFSGAGNPAPAVVAPAKRVTKKTAGCKKSRVKSKKGRCIKRSRAKRKTGVKTNGRAK